MRLEELEKENKRLEKEVQTADARWKKTEEQLEDLREASGDVVELKEKLAQAEKRAEEVDKLVCYVFISSVLGVLLSGPCRCGSQWFPFRKKRSQSYNAKTLISKQGHIVQAPAFLCLVILTQIRLHY